MFDFITKLEQIRDTLKKGAGGTADVLEQFRDTVDAAVTFLRDVEGGKVFALSPVDEEKLDVLATEFHAIAAGSKGDGKKGAAAAFDPAEWVQLALMVAELIKLIRSRRKQ